MRDDHPSPAVPPEPTGPVSMDDSEFEADLAAVRGEAESPPSREARSPMTRRDWGIGVAVVSAAIVIHAIVPRYSWRQERSALVRIDRWSGQSMLGDFGEGGRWVDLDELRAQRVKAESDKAWDKRMNEILLEVAQKTADDAKEKASDADSDARDALEIIALLKSGAAVPERPANMVYHEAAKRLADEQATAALQKAR